MAQVQCMRAIYKSAQRVVIRVDPASGESDLAIAFIQKLVDFFTDDNTINSELFNKSLLINDANRVIAPVRSRLPPVEAFEWTASGQFSPDRGSASSGLFRRLC